jgi:hypothetical protein
MFSTMTFINRTQKNILCITALLVSFGAVAADDEYLKMLENEAMDLEVDKSGQLESEGPADKGTMETIIKENWKVKGVLEGNTFPQGLTQEEFEELLKQNFYGSYVFFQKLNSIDQQTIFYNYTQASPAYLDSVRQDIMDHLKNR